MDYKLALELKKAGFPQKLVFGDKFYYQEGQDGLWDDLKQDIISTNAMKEEWLKLNPRMVKIPTLSELIEACGDEFRALRLDSSMKTENNEQWACDRVEHGVFETFIGKTPEESVARLYIKLNKK